MEDQIVMPPYQGVPAPNQRTQAIRIGPGAAHGRDLYIGKNQKLYDGMLEVPGLLK